MRAATPIGKEFDRLTIEEELPDKITKGGNKVRMVLAKCKCGKTVIVQLGNLRSGVTRSCGCLKEERDKTFGITHGLSRHPLYRILHGMITRCTNSNRDYWYCYGERGISVCDEWIQDPPSFIRWALEHGWRPGLQIDRLDNDGGYSPSNCRISTPMENGRNKRNTKMLWFGNVFLPVVEWAELTGISYRTLVRRVTNGWSAFNALTVSDRRSADRASDECKAILRKHQG